MKLIHESTHATIGAANRKADEIYESATGSVHEHVRANKDGTVRLKVFMVEGRKPRPRAWKERTCHECGARLGWWDFVEHAKESGISRDRANVIWNDNRIGVLCCGCLDLENIKAVHANDWRQS